ncbi:MATE family efflux transporter [Gammaproteobacteria bacterium]|nr:MATE family efflux transporter [Gammaproteobacteria bacterium]MDA9112277.1 MATE family efflux transporter [Gammaproteobacteria bacterium]MDB4059685.1 MATE family efflux transporter [Gammaproteobacteria bacterium]MDB9997413.1 MATE family efflux transporter [Gammaproteobacteria bacterium]MDC1491525.1 MATE family efflux transporter [Gammaproteobacteria bacterium]|tara:strand:+ start:5730 stop:7091 length:1362 start_codon:yes stop_codon:yes gene_type:complete
MEVVYKESGIPKGSSGVWSLAWPTIITNLLFASSSIIAIKVVGDLGQDAVAATITGQRLSFILQAVLMGILSGTTALMARHWGAKEPEESSKYLARTIQLTLSFSIVFSFLLWFYAEPLIAFLGLKDNALVMSVIYLKYLAPFLPFLAIGLSITTGFRSIGDVKTPLIISLIMNVIGVSFMVVLTHGYLGFNNYGVYGAAIGNGISFICGAVLSMIVWRMNLVKAKYSSLFVLDVKRIKKIFEVGFPSALEQVIFQLGINAFLIIVAQYGTTAYAAYGVGIQILAFSFVIGFGFSMAGASLVGQHMGAGDNIQAKRSAWSGMKLSIVFMTIFGAFIIFFAEPIVGFLINDADVIKLTVIFIWIMGSLQPLMAVEFSLGGALRGAGDTRSPLFITLTCLLFIRVLSALVLLYIGAGIEMIFATLIADYFVKAILFVKVFRSEKWMEALTIKEDL